MARPEVTLLGDAAMDDTMAGVHPVPPGLLTTPPRTRLTSLLSAAVPVVQSAAAAGVSLYVAHDVIGHPKPFFAPISALIVLGVASTDRMRRVVELALGVCLGIGVGDLLVSQIGTGSWQVALVVLMAMSAAIVLGGGPVFVGEAATSGVLVATVAGGAHGSRFIDALVGGLVGLFAVVVLPQNPLRIARREAALFFAELGAALDDIAEALERRDVALGRQALARTRRAEPAIVAWRSSLALGFETARLSPLHWRSRTRLDEYAVAAVQLELAVRNARVLARSAVRAVETTPETPAELVAAVRRLAERGARGRAGARAARPLGADRVGARSDHACDARRRARAGRSPSRTSSARSGRSPPICCARSASTGTSPSSTSAEPPSAARPL